MARADKALLTFNGGAWSPKLAGRVDLEGASSALRSSVNFLVRPSGAARRRPGLRFVASVTEPVVPPEPVAEALFLGLESQVVLEAVVPLNDQPFI